MYICGVRSPKNRPWSQITTNNVRDIYSTWDDYHQEVKDSDEYKLASKDMGYMEAYALLKKMVRKLKKQERMQLKAAMILAD